MSFPKINPKQSFPKLEEEILAYWEKEKLFSKSLEKDSPAGEFKFFDGPPFATGLPHYGHILQGVIKDLIPRYKTMQGYKVPRVWGWDCHGLPVENLVEKDLGLKSKQDVEKYGVDKFNEACRSSVLKYAEEWKKTVKRMGRWIDTENAYKTMDLEYMDSVWWVFGELWQKGLIYEGLKPMHICPRCETPLSNFEVGLGYKDITDLSATVKFELKDEPGTYLLAWTTTPWTLLGNVALAVNPKEKYVRLRRGGKNFIIAKDLWKKLWGKVFNEPGLFKRSDPSISPQPELLTHEEEIFLGSELIDKTYKPLFSQFANLVNPRDISGVNGESGKDNHEALSGLYFITFNTENSTKIFKDEKLRDACAEAFREAAEKNDYKIYELAIMPDHIHLVIGIEDGGDSLPKALQQLKGSSSKKLKTKLTPELTRGLTVRLDSKSKEYFPLWRKGYDKKFIYSDDKYANISNYIRQNPEKAKLPPQKYDWLKIFDDVNHPIKFPEQKPQEGFRIVAGDFVTTDEGTGIVHIAPAFGEDDYEIAKKENLPIIQHVSLDGKFVKETGEFAGLEAKPAKNPRETDEKIVKWLEDEGKLFAKENYKHSYPHCWRCETPLLNYATSSWFVNVEKIKKDLLKNNQEINWVPAHIRDGRFGKWLEGARDWAISRNRFWGAPLPIWRCEKCEEAVCVNSKEELEKLSGEKMKDLHKHFVDKIEWGCEQCDGKMKRVPEVLDCWFESGSMPYAQFGEKEKAQIPANFIAEAQDQTRGWFYTLHVLATALKGKPAFSNCVCSGLVLAEDGTKMSKSKQNFPAPQKIFDKYGADAMRLYLMQSQVTHAEDLRFSERGVEETLRSVLLPLWNTFYFFTTYANADGWEPTSSLTPQISGGLTVKNKLDAWILSELNILIREMSEHLEAYEIQKAVSPLAKFLDGLTNWYIRRSRRRFWKSENDEDKNEAYATLLHVLTEVSKLLAPITPFLAEKIYRDLTGRDSVHLEAWPKVDKSRIDEDLSKEVDTTRKIISLGLAIRAREKIKIRQPLENLTLGYASAHVPVVDKVMDSQSETIKEELNVKNIERGFFEEFVKTNLVLDSKKIGSRFGKKTQDLINAAKSGKWKPLEEGGALVLNEAFSPEEFSLRFEPVDNLDSNIKVEADSNNIVVGLDIKITPELELEGKARDLVRVIQDLRKKADYDVSDRIELQLEDAEEILKVHEKYIATETLAEKISNKLNSPDVEDSLEKIKIGVCKSKQ